MDSSLDIFRITADYLERRLTLGDVQEWLVPRLGIFLLDNRSTAAELAGLFELGFADIAAGEADEEELRGLVLDFVRDNATVFLADTAVSTSSNAVTDISLLEPAPRSTFQPA